MQKMLSHGAVAEDNWTVLQTPWRQFPRAIFWCHLNTGSNMAPSSDRQAGLVGVWLDSDEEVEALVDDLGATASCSAQLSQVCRWSQAFQAPAYCVTAMTTKARLEP